MLMLVGLLASWSPLPYSLFALVPLVWAGLESVWAIRAGSASAAPRRSIVSSVVGLVLVSVLTLMVLLPYAVYGRAKNLQDCTSGANTAIARAECNSQVRPFLGGLLDGGR
jgi:hypothetical protein